MPNDITQKAIKMMLNGGTLLSEPCPYCKGVRVMKDGHALCVNCGKEPKQKPTKTQTKEKKSVSTLKTLEQKLEKLSSQLEGETDPAKQQGLIKSIDSLIDVIAKLKSNKKVFIFTFLLSILSMADKKKNAPLPASSAGLLKFFG